MNLQVDLCCGLGGWQAPFREDPSWRSVGLDVDPDVQPDILADVRELPLDCNPTLVTASPPCQEFSLIQHPKIEPGDADYSIWQGCESAIQTLDPDWWAIENVRGAIRHMGPPTGRYEPYYLWGYYPPMDVGEMPQKTSENRTIPDAQQASKIPYGLARALKRAVEVWG